LEKYLLEPDDIVISRAGSVGFSRLIEEIPSHTVFASYLIRFKPSPAVVPRYLAAYLNSDAYWTGIGAASVGIALANVNAKNLAALPVPLAPLAEQKRIADKLDTVLTRVDAVNTRLARVAPLLKRFRQSVLAAATSGRLTEDWRAEATAVDEWVESPQPLRDVVSLDFGFAFKSTDFVSDGVRLLRGDNIEPGALRWRDAKCLPAENIDSERHIQLEAGDVVIAMDRPLISTGLKVARVTGDDLPCLLVQRVCRFRSAGVLQPDYLYVVLRSQAFVNHLGAVQNGSSIPHISGGQILSFQLSLPTTEEQTEIVRRVETLFAFADRLEARLQTAQTATERLTPSLLAKAFRGELVPQDPNDEPASELLKRLVSSTTTVSKRGRRSKAAE